jgi:cobalt/nickel transport system permease protein
MAYIPVPVTPPPEITALHIPDGFVSAPVAVAGYVVTAVVLAYAVRQTNRKMGDKAAPLMGVLAAFIFAAQMINFPVAGGTSGHLLGGTLAAILIGPWAGILAMAAVISVQALVFQDGGLSALGVNIFNMGILTSLLGYGIYMSATAMLPKSSTVRVGSAFVAAWITVVTAAALTSVQLAISGTSPLDIALPAMLGVHVFIGIGEGLITAAAVALVAASRPDLLEDAGTGATIQMQEAHS